MEAMTTTIDPVMVDELKQDPFYLGWRDELRPLPNGDYYLERVPLTLEDILHPQEEDFRVHSRNHQRFCMYLYDVFSARLAADPQAIVLHDVRVAWDEPEIKPHGPDIAVIFGVQERLDWSTFAAQEEGTKPTLVVEVTSPKTRQVDLIRKVDEYEQAGLLYYLIVDTHQRKGKAVRRLLGYHLTEEGYVTMTPDERGWLWLPPLQVWLGIENNEPRCYDEAGVPLGDYIEVSAARVEAEAKAREAEAQAAAEAQARAEAEARIRQLEAELRRLRGEE